MYTSTIGPKFYMAIPEGRSAAADGTAIPDAPVQTQEEKVSIGRQGQFPKTVPAIFIGEKSPSGELQPLTNRPSPSLEMIQKFFASFGVTVEVIAVTAAQIQPGIYTIKPENPELTEILEEIVKNDGDGLDAKTILNVAKTLLNNGAKPTPLDLYVAAWNASRTTGEKEKDRMALLQLFLQNDVDPQAPIPGASFASELHPGRNLSNLEEARTYLGDDHPNAYKVLKLLEAYAKRPQG